MSKLTIHSISPNPDALERHDGLRSFTVKYIHSAYGGGYPFASAGLGVDELDVFIKFKTFMESRGYEVVADE